MADRVVQTSTRALGRRADRPGRLDREVEDSSIGAMDAEKTFWLSRPDGWVINKETKRIIMLEFKRTSDTVEKYYSEMKSIAERQHTPILEGLNALTEQRGWVMEVLPLVAGQRSVREKEWLELNGF